jgi:hypothetical protein
MKKTFSKFLVAPLTVLVLASFAMTPVAEARGGGGGGGGARASAGGGGGGARAGGGGGGRQVDNSSRDARANDTRSTSVNNVNANRNTNVNKNTNVNANRNVNVNVDNHGGWDNDYHPVARAAAVTATVAVTAAVIGSMVNTVPANCVPVNYGGMVYQQCGSTWYQPQGGQYVVINPPY